MAIRKVEDNDRDLPISSMLRLYSVIKDTDGGEEFLNVFRAYAISEDVYNNEGFFDYYTVQEDDWLDNISTVFYATPYLWWVVGIFNGITNPYEGLTEGDVIRVLRFENVYTIFDDLGIIESL